MFKAPTYEAKMWARRLYEGWLKDYRPTNDATLIDNKIYYKDSLGNRYRMTITIERAD